MADMLGGQVTISVQIVTAVYPVPALLNIANNRAAAQIVNTVVSSDDNHDSGRVVNLALTLARRLADIQKLEIPAKLREMLEQRFIELMNEENLE